MRKMAKKGSATENAIERPAEPTEVQPAQSLLRGAPRHGCGTAMELGTIGQRLVLLCPKCYPRFPDRTEEALRCPACGRPLAMQPWPRDRHYCGSCEKWFIPFPWDRPATEPGTMPVYGELKNDGVGHWTEENPKRFLAWGRKADEDKRDSERRRRR